MLRSRTGYVRGESQANCSPGQAQISQRQKCFLFVPFSIVFVLGKEWSERVVIPVFSLAFLFACTARAVSSRNDA